MEKLTDEEVGKEFIVLWDNCFDETTKKIITRAIKGYFNVGQRANQLLQRLIL